MKAFERLTIQWIIAVAPIVLLAGFAIVRSLHLADWQTVLFVRENGPVEMATFAAFVVAAGLAVLAARQNYPRGGAYRFVAGALLLFAVLAAVVAMEEIAWTQQFFGFDTPDEIEVANVQRETTIHNMEGIHGKASHLYFAFGIGGFVASALRSLRGGLRGIATLAPPPLLLSYFGSVFLYAFVKLQNEQARFTPAYDMSVRYNSEIAELVIGLAALIYAAHQWQTARHISRV